MPAMIHSMTAYASRTGTHGAASWMWELRSVNARGLDLRLRLPDGLGEVETQVRTALKSAVARGNLTCSLRLTRDEAALPLRLDTAQLDRVLDALDTVQERAFAKGVTLGQPSAADVLGQRGVILHGQDESDDSALTTALAADLGPLIEAFVAMRAAEGAALKAVLSDQLDTIARLTEDAARLAEARRPEQAAALRDAFTRIRGEVSEADDARLEQELALIAVKQDVTEEIDRLRAHVAAAREMLESAGPSGRKLDFLAQEFNREANTLCSKVQNAALTAVGLDLKAVIDQMREQVQNVE